MNLVINIGNSNIRLGFFDENGIVLSSVINTHPIRSEDEYRITIYGLYKQNKINVTDVKRIVLGSVVPTLTPILTRALQKLHSISPILVSRDTPSAVKHNSKQIGTDLYANAVAAHENYEGKKLVIDFGTALTLTGVDEKGGLLGVIIAPGVVTSLNALVGDTAQLPDIEMVQPKTVLGLDTETCMQSGMVYGFLGMIEGLICRTQTEYEENFTVIATGGMGHVYAPLTSAIHHFDRLHTLNGLLLLSNYTSLAKKDSIN